VFVSTSDFAGWLVDSLRCGVIAIDADGALCAFNDEARRILACEHMEPEESLGRDCRAVLADQPAVAVLLVDALAGEVEHERAELVLADAGPGPERVVGFSLAPVRDSKGEIRGAALFFRDLSSLERLEEQIRLRDRLAVLGEMAARMAHEIRNPLAGMKVMAELLERRLRGRDDELSLVAELVSELRAVDRVVGEGLDFVRSTPPILERVDGSELLERCVTRALARVGWDGEIVREVEASPPAVVADPGQLQAVVTNLLINAMEATSTLPDAAARRIWLRLYSRAADPARRPRRLEAADAAARSALSSLPGEGSGREVVISVVDSGPGIEPELRERIFYPFFTTKNVGSGVGLSTAQKIVADHGGRIELEESAEGGAAFHVRLPVLALESRIDSARGAQRGEVTSHG
jgi:signal transduction histidine kinase